MKEERMVYLYDEFCQACPKISKTSLNKFLKSEKNLHEMTLSELNEEVSKWRGLKSRSIGGQRANLIYYLKWLKSQGIDTDPEIMRQVEFPSQEEEYFIYSTADIHELWHKLFNELEKQAAIQNKVFSRKSYLVCYASGILSFYGLTSEQILGLNLSDVRTNGVYGYDINFTKEDLDILLEYKNLTVLENGKKLGGYKYVRTVEEHGDSASGRIINYALSRVKSQNKNNSIIRDIANKVTSTFLFECGVYNRIFNYEIEHNTEVQNQAFTPDWFVEFVNVFNRKQNDDGSSIINDTSVCNYKKKYINYRTERKAYIKIMSQKKI